ncbi:MAG: Gfo/Idh/MocA family oxidoreductase [Planctomycetes bacterium]|nr:Gfo/Idh/MocA family oxidoreductase [Planctomycetota bacterium]
MTERIRVGIAGLGRSGWDIHAKSLKILTGEYQISAVCDPDERRLSEAKDNLNCRTYTTLNGLLGNPDVELIVIATPSNLHAENTIRTLKTGKAVVCEKPMATTLADADLMIEEYRKTGSLLTIFQNYRYMPGFLKVKEIIDSGKLGRIILVRMAWHSFGRRWDWQTLKKFGGGTLNNTCPHVIDQALQILGPVEPEIFCQMEKAITLGDVEDHLKIILKVPRSPLIDIEVTSACAYPQESWLVMGTQGSLTGTYSKLRWKYFRPEELPERKVDTTPTLDRSYNREEIHWYEEEWSLPEDKKPEPVMFYLDLYNTIRKNAALAITPESARRVMWVSERCRQLCPV